MRIAVSLLQLKLWRVWFCYLELIACDFWRRLEVWKNFTSTVNRRKKLIAGQLYFCPLEKFRWLKLDLVLANRPDLDVELMHVWQIRDSNCTPFRNSSLLSRSENKTSVPDNHMHKDKITFYLYPPPPLRFSSEGFSLHSAVLCCTSLHFSTQHLEGQRRWSHGID